MNVYFTKDISAQGVLKAFHALDVQPGGNVGIKLHFGEKGNHTFLPAPLVQPLAEQLNATLVESTVLYVSPRRYPDVHRQLAHEHGFTFAPIDILDEEGEEFIDTPDGKHFSKVRVASHVKNYDMLVVYSHFKGHVAASFGGAIKNVAMGLASPGGKLDQHASTVPTVNANKCVECGACVPNCPVSAITLNPVEIDPAVCIGCASCIGVCPEGVFGVPWGASDESSFIERMVEYASAYAQRYPMVFVTVIANVTPYCDCMAAAGEPFIGDVGILASTDIVAIEQAALDMVNTACQCGDAFAKHTGVHGGWQLDYAQQLGMGSRDYTLVNLDD